MNRKARIVFTFLISGLLVLAASCAPSAAPAPAPTPTPGIPSFTGSPGGPSTPPPPIPPPAGAINHGILEIRVTDPPPADVTKAIIYLSNLEVHRVSSNVTDNVSDNTSDGGGEWIPVLGAPPSFDLMDVIGVTALLGSVNITAGRFTQIRMDVDKVEVTTTNGENFTAEIPSGKLKIVRPFNVSPGQRTVLTIDFDGEKSLIVTGKGKALFKPVVKLLIETGKSANDGGADGKEKPRETGKPVTPGKPPETGKPSK